VESDQGRYYAGTAGTYEDAHVTPGDAHFVALEYMLGLFTTFRVSSVLDVGSGTGRSARFIMSRRPDITVVGLEPVAELRQIAQDSGGRYVDGSVMDLPFENDHFDAVIATGVMHHLAEPEMAIREMMRVARVAVLISDSNRFGQGPVPERVLKAALYRLRLWPLFTRISTRGRGHLYSEGDGIFYSYSVYDNARMLAQWADNLFLIPTTSQADGRWRAPLLTSTTLLLAAVRHPSEGWAGVPQS
jgi:ubiquinone/menaquinone biosynthesis C-methylase UbiE